MADLTVRRTLSVAPERVWRAFTTSELAAWFWPPSWVTVADLDLGEGYHLWSDTSGMGINGEYLAVEPHERLQQSWRWDDDGYETVVTITFEAEGDGTVLTVVHEGFADDQSRDDHIQGWNDCLDRLPAALGR
jgi:uncharacterized protein YndB with AHSA1/START domain